MVGRIESDMVYINVSVHVCVLTLCTCTCTCVCMFLLILCTCTLHVLVCVCRYLTEYLSVQEKDFRYIKILSLIARVLVFITTRGNAHSVRLVPAELTS